jgi:hypothetical protein
MRVAWATFAAKGDPGSAAVRWPSVNNTSAVLSFVSPEPQIQTTFAAAHHCAFWAAG